MSNRLFMPAADANYITITRDKFKIQLTPAETDKATGLLGIALSMESIEALPEYIRNSPFIVRFFEDGKLALERLDLPGSIPFEWDQADELISAIQDGLRIAINERTLVKGARGTGFVPMSQEPFI